MEVYEYRAVKGMRHCRSIDLGHNEIDFPNGLLEIQCYHVEIMDSKEVPRKYIIEVHKYLGFAMIKYFPHDRKKHPKKYELRGKKELGYELKPKSVIDIIFQSAYVMKEYLDENKESFVGYIGQIDKKDNIRKRNISQRCSIYNILTSSIFQNADKYKFSTNKIFREVNLRLIRVKVSKQENKLTATQMKNYNSFLSTFRENTKLHYDLMTDITKEKVVKEMEERKNVATQPLS